MIGNCSCGKFLLLVRLGKKVLKKEFGGRENE